ncbi:DUF6770 family protein [Spongiimicrobium sp. 2-473A-2-J]|uniref:DUF6770 family protein n=1 Tax=Eudoraea algarum TaxID=3417568 RepID=UPI003D35B71C
MKNITLLTLLLLVSNINVYAQNRTIANITKFNVKNSGAISDGENDVDGYYFFYEVDKLENKEREYAIQILDKNLNDVATKSMISKKRTVLIGKGFNGDQLTFALFSKLDKKIEIVSFDKQANNLTPIQLPVSPGEFRRLASQSKARPLNLLLPVDNKGFLLKRLLTGKKSGYAMQYFPTNGGKKWEFHSDKTSQETLDISTIAINEKVVVLLEKSQRYASSAKMSLRTIVLEIDTGNLLFTRDYDELDPRLITNAFITKEDQIVFLGQYYKPKAKLAKAESLGLYTEVYHMDGTLSYENKLSWKDHISKKVAIKKGSKTKDYGYIYFHEIVRMGNDGYYAIGEQYSKKADAAGIALGVLAAAGGGATAGGFTKLTITDAIVFKFDNKFDLIDVEIFEKGKSNIPNVFDFGSPQMNAHMVKALGGFDYAYTQIDKENNRFYANFIDYERLKGEQNKLAFKTIIHDEGELSSDKIYLEEGKTNFFPLPAKIGYVLLMEYDKEKKEISIHTEKLNIE